MGGGTFIQVQVIMGFSGYFSGNAVLKNIFTCGELTTTGFPTSTDALDKVNVYGGRISLYVRSNGTYKNLSVVYNNNTKIWFYYNTHQKIYLINPINAFPAQTTLFATSFVLRTIATPTTAIANCFYYDDSSGTYTDYTTACNNDTVDDVPLNGDVNDMLYFKITGANTDLYAPVLKFTTNNATNDYVYKWQIYVNTLGWVDVENYWDETNNFTINNKYVYIKPTIATGDDGESIRSWLSTTINGVSGYWVRLKIVTKGTTTPTFTRLCSGLEKGVSNWNIYQQYTLDLTVNDEDGNLLDGATVVCKDNLGTTLFTATTSLGILPQQTITQRMWLFDPITYSDNYHKIGNVDYNPFTITVSKSGYETYTSTFDITAKLNTTITLKPIVPIRQTLDGDLLLANQPETGSSAKLLKI